MSKKIIKSIENMILDIRESVYEFTRGSVYSDDYDLFSKSEEECDYIVNNLCSLKQEIDSLLIEISEAKAFRRTHEHTVFMIGLDSWNDFCRNFMNDTPTNTKRKYPYLYKRHEQVRKERQK